jgi:hypothetical protein
LESYDFTRTYIKATLDPETDLGESALRRAARHAQDSAAWKYFGIETSHVVASNRPGELASRLLDVANGAPADVTER